MTDYDPGLDVVVRLEGISSWESRTWTRGTADVKAIISNMFSHDWIQVRRLGCAQDLTRENSIVVTIIIACQVEKWGAPCVNH